MSVLTMKSIDDGSWQKVPERYILTMKNVDSESWRRSPEMYLLTMKNVDNAILRKLLIQKINDFNDYKARLEAAFNPPPETFSHSPYSDKEPHNIFWWVPFAFKESDKQFEGEFIKFKFEDKMKNFGTVPVPVRDGKLLTPILSITGPEIKVGTDGVSYIVVYANGDWTGQLEGHLNNENWEGFKYYVQFLQDFPDINYPYIFSMFLDYTGAYKTAPTWNDEFPVKLYKHCSVEYDPNGFTFKPEELVIP